MSHGITEGPLGRAVFRLAWPVIVAEALHTAFQIVDIVWIAVTITGTCLLRAVILVLWFRRNAWQRAAVLT